MKKISILLIILISMFSLTSCNDAVIVGKKIQAGELNYAENDDYIVTSSIIFDKFTHEINIYRSGSNTENVYLDGDDGFNVKTYSYNYETSEQEDIYIYYSFSGAELKRETREHVNQTSSMAKDGFSSSTLGYDPDDHLEDLTRFELKIWQVAKSLSLKNSNPYMIEGKYCIVGSKILFYVNVYDKCMFKGGKLVDQGIYCCYIYELDIVTLDTKELYKIDQHKVLYLSKNIAYTMDKKQNLYIIDSNEQHLEIGSLSYADHNYFFTDDFIVDQNGKVTDKITIYDSFFKELATKQNPNHGFGFFG